MVAPRKSGALSVSTGVEGMPDCTLPATLEEGGDDVTAWRAQVVGSDGAKRLRLQGTTDGDTWTHLRAHDCGQEWSQPLDGSMTFDGGGVTSLLLGSSTMPYRGKLRAAFTGSHIFGVNVVLLDDYLRSVVPSEMPASWSPAALQAQAVAARTYASYGIAHPKNRAYYDVYDDTRDQMYLGKSREVASTDAAVEATQNAAEETADVLHDAQGQPAFTQFSSSDGGWTVSGGQPYMPAQRDPYDGLVPSSVHSWRTTVAASTITSVYGDQIGQLRAVLVTGRDGNGQWGGRVTGMTLRGTKGNVDVTGSSFRYAVGLRSEWFRVLPPPGRPTEVSAARTDGAVSVTRAEPATSEGARVTGYRVTLQPGGITKRVDGDVHAVSFDPVATKDARTVDVVATSSVGPGRPSTVTTRVHRLQGTSRVATAIAVSQSTFADRAADAVVLARQSAGPETFAAGPLAAAHSAPVLLTKTDALPPASETELRRVLLPGGTVYLLGGVDVIGKDVRARLVTAGYRVHRFGGSTPAAVARHVADDVAATGTVSAAFEVDATDATSAWAAGAVAASRRGVVLLTTAGQRAPETAAWLRKHPSVATRFAVGSAAAAADPDATAISGADAAGTALAVATRFFPAPRRLAVVSADLSVPGLVASARMALRRGPVLFSAGDRLGGAAARYVGDRRDRLGRVDLVGARLPYVVESAVQRALLG
jgi:SpoIID/LytB domain protein